ncbi:MAG: nuclear transport factor 2 family protein [Gammaproteobacteria bacterium]
MKQPEVPEAGADALSPVQGSAAPAGAVDGFKALYLRLNAENCWSHLINGVYRRDMVFEDPFHRIEGIRGFKVYCAALYENLLYCRFRFHDEWEREGDAVLNWTMEYAHPKLNRGRDVRVEGVSRIIFDEKVFYHRDYFDAGALLYEHLPILGGVIRTVKRNMS